MRPATLVASRASMLRSLRRSQTIRCYSAASRPSSTGSSHSRTVLGTVAAVAGGAALFWAGSLHGTNTNTTNKLPVIQYADHNGMVQAVSEIEHVLDEGVVSYDEDDIETHGYSDWSTSNSTGRAVAVVYPRTTEDVSKIASICYKHNVPIVPFGAGSSVEGNFSSPYSGIVIDFTHMDNIIAYHPNDMDVVVGPGTNWVELNKMTQKDGLFLPLDPSPTATVGGMVSTNCSGTNAFRYGTMKDWVINVTAVLADGRVIKTRRRPRKTSAGYNLTSLFVGAEGTLGIITEITLKLATIPKETGVMVVSFPTIRDATSAAVAIIRSGVQLAAMELMDDTQMQVLNRHGSEAVRRTKWDETATIFLKFSGPTKQAIEGDISRIKDLARPHMPRTYHQARTKQEEMDLWSGRKEALWTMTSIKPEGHAIWSTDVAVPISRLAEIIELSKEDGKELGFFTSIVGHIGDGNFHEALMYDPQNPVHRAGVRTAVDRMTARALEMEGTVSGEHAIGLGKMGCLVDELGIETINVMKQVKQALDPKWLLNPGKVFDLPDGSRAVAADRLAAEKSSRSR